MNFYIQQNNNYLHDRMKSACTLHYCTLCFLFAIISRPPTPTDTSSTMLVLLRRPSTSLYPDGY